MRHFYRQMHEKQRHFKYFSSHYAYTAVYFQFTNYVFGDTRNRAENQQTLLEITEP